MSDDEIRIAVAESVGWKSHMDAEGDLSEPHLTRHFEVWTGPKGQQDSEPPDFCNDLNAMHEVENELEKQGLWIDYCKIIEKAVKNPLKATARQRAEAYLRTKALWKDEVKV